MALVVSEKESMDSNFISLFISVVLLIISVFVSGFLKKLNAWYYNIRLGKKMHNLPPGDMGWPLLGNMLSFFKAFKSQNPDTFIYNLVSRYGRTGIYKTHMFWSPAVIVCTPETCRKVLADDEHFKLGYPISTTQLMGRKSFHGIPDPEHKRLRRLTTAPINGHEALSMYIPYIEDIVVHSLDEWASSNHTIEFFNEIRRVSFKIITHIFVAPSAESILGKAEKYYSDLTDGMKSAAINFPGFAFHKALQGRNMVVKILQSVLDERRSSKTDDPTKHERGMIDLLMEIEDHERGEKLEDEDIIDLLIVFLLAGHESTAHAAMWAIIYLNNNPEMLQNAREEQEQILKKRPSTQKSLTMKEIREMKYLAKVIDETLRRTSISFMNFREAKVDVNIKGYLIPKGWKVLVWNRAVHMDPETYPNPLAFNPSRWDNPNPKAGSFIPFGGGSRICPGADLAKLVTSIFLHYFLLDYKLEQVNPRGPVVYLPLARPADKCLAKVMKLS